MNTPLEIYKLLNGSNCKKCLLPSCMAFAAAIFQGQKQLHECPEIDLKSTKMLGHKTKPIDSASEEQSKLDVLMLAASKVDFTAVAEKLGAIESQGRLTINCLGKNFTIRRSGGINSECHTNLWIHLPLLSYIANGKGLDIKDQWLPFNQLSGAASWSRFFYHRCEADLNQLADNHTELFLDILTMFGAQEFTNTNADHSFVIHPLPKLPIQINYWIATEEFEAKLNILFDITAPDNLEVEYIYMITRGIVEMFRALVVKHNKDGEFI